jgi:hypothetical protein
MASDVSGGGYKLRREKSTDGPLHRRPSSLSSAPERDTQQNSPTKATTKTKTKTKLLISRIPALRIAGKSA